MAVSGSFDFTLNKKEVMDEAFARIGYLSEGYSPSAYDYQRASKALNMWLKSIQRDSNFLFTHKDAVLFLDKTSQYYDLGTTHAALVSDFIETTLGAVEALGQTTLTVTSSAGMIAGDFIGIELSTGVRQWTTIASVDDATTVTVNDALTAQASSGATIYSYTTKLRRPLEVSNVRVRFTQDTNKTERPLTNLSRTEYNNVASKFTTGSIASYFYDRQRVTPGRIFIWPVNNRVDDIVYFSAHQDLDDMDTETDTLPVPAEWEMCVVFNLASQLGLVYGIDQERYANVTRMAKYEYERVKFQSNDLTEIKFDMMDDDC